MQWVGTHYVIQVTTTPTTTTPLTDIGVVLLIQDYLETAFDALLAREVIAARSSGLHAMGIVGYDTLGVIKLWLKELPDPDELRTTLYNASRRALDERDRAVRAAAEYERFLRKTNPRG